MDKPNGHEFMSHDQKSRSTMLVELSMDMQTISIEIDSILAKSHGCCHALTVKNELKIQEVYLKNLRNRYASKRISAARTLI